ncbi:MAG: family 20 glycosylhydrolase [Elusimicrobia bacterium]|nr:family 20 glycosylhydrolase [Elusimicrobiota bacterium]
MSMDLLPVPLKIIRREGRFRLTPSFGACVLGRPAPRIFGAATRMLGRLAGRTGMFFPQDFITAESPDVKLPLRVECRRPGSVRLGEDESYGLRVGPARIVLRAECDLGVLRGLETLFQLLSVDEGGYYFPAVTIEDRPRFPWRGLMIDVCRHFLPLEIVKRNLDAMAAVKLNVLHLHLTDDQGFRVECKTFPKLHELGSDGRYFTQEQMREIIAYADDRGIRVVPEFDVPGHATSWLVAFPRLASAPGPYKIQRRWGVFDPTFDPTNENVYKFFDKFFHEMSGLFADEYIHIGGDENNGKQWDANPAIQAFKKRLRSADNHALQGYFNGRILKILAKHGKKATGWDDILRPGVPKDMIIQAWRGNEFVAEAVRQGCRALLSKGYYIDLIQPAAEHYLNDPAPAGMLLNSAQRKKILGGEATMWGEMIDQETVDSRIWPRTAAIAERLWSAAEVRDVDDMYRRLGWVSLRLEELGLTHEKNYDMMLRRLAAGADISALRTLVDLLEPVKLYARHAQTKDFTSHSPCTRIVDAARPDSRAAREFEKLVDALLAGKKEAAEAVRARLLSWKGNHEALAPVIRRSPILREIIPLSENLETVSELGLECLDRLAAGRTAGEAWGREKRKLIEAAKAPCAQTELMIVPVVERLLQAASS